MSAPEVSVWSDGQGAVVSFCAPHSREELAKLLAIAAGAAGAAAGSSWLACGLAICVERRIPDQPVFVLEPAATAGSAAGPEVYLSLDKFVDLVRYRALLSPLEAGLSIVIDRAGVRLGGKSCRELIDEHKKRAFVFSWPDWVDALEVMLDLTGH